MYIHIQDPYTSLFLHNIQGGEDQKSFPLFYAQSRTKPNDIKSMYYLHLKAHN